MGVGTYMASYLAYLVRYLFFQSRPLHLSRYIDPDYTMSPSAINTKDVYETINELTAPLNDMSSIDPLITLLALTYKTQTPSPSKQDRLLTLMHTISSSSTPDKIYSHVEQRNSFIRLISPALNGMAGLQDFEKAVRAEATADPEGFRTFWQLEERNLLKETVQNGLMGGSSPGAEVVFLDTFVGKEGRRCKVGLGDERTLMLVDEETEVGDVVRLVRNEKDGRVWFEGKRIGPE